MESRSIRYSFSRFVVVGAFGFLIDASVLTALNIYFGVNVYLARAASFSLATLATWWLNRLFTFGESSSNEGRTREYARYFATQVGGALINLGIFALLMHQFRSLQPWPVIPLTAGAIGGLVFNYTLAHRWVFQGGRTNE